MSMSSSPSKSKKTGFLRAKLNNFIAKKYKGEKKKRNVQNIMGIECLMEDVS